MKSFALITICILITGLSYSQIKSRNAYSKQQRIKEKRERLQQLIKLEEEGSLVYQKQSVFGIKLNTDGYGIVLEKGRMKTIRKSNLYSLELGERKHPKEEKAMPGAASTLANNYIYGKINNFYYAKLGFGQQQLIGSKGSKNGVEVSAIYGGGLSAGLMKPYYLKIQLARIIADVKYDNNDDVFLFHPEAVHGATRFTKGFTEIKVYPGAFMKTALRFDYGRYNQIVSALEVGLNVEVYNKKIPQMLLVENKQFFLNAYVALEFGKRK